MSLEEKRRREDAQKTETDAGPRLLQAREHRDGWQRPETVRHRADSPPEPPEENNAVDALASDFWQPELERILPVVSPQSVVICFGRN